MDKDSGLVHHLKVTGANEHDVTAAPDPMHREEKELYGDSGYIGAEKRENAVLLILITNQPIDKSSAEISQFCVKLPCRAASPPAVVFLDLAYFICRLYL